MDVAFREDRGEVRGSGKRWQRCGALSLSPVPLWLAQSSFLHIRELFRLFVKTTFVYRAECILYFFRNKSLEIEFLCQRLSVHMARLSSYKIVLLFASISMYESSGSLDLELHWAQSFLTMQTFFVTVISISYVLMRLELLFDKFNRHFISSELSVHFRCSFSSQN